MKIIVPPIKIQGIKSKLVSWINTVISQIDYENYYEPFLGSGVVAFNLKPRNAILADSNPHLINFYKAIQDGIITSQIVREYLEHHGSILLNTNGEYYYEVRNRFNDNGNPLDFLFINRSCFNGMMRFNRGGGFNVPFCRKPNRFAKAYITKIVNQVEAVSRIIQDGNYKFLNLSFDQTLVNLNENDLVYCDPPYIGRHVDYFDSWSEIEEIQLRDTLDNSNSNYILSTWLQNKYRINDYVFKLWGNNNISTKEHFYHVGAKETNRNAVTEALITNFGTKLSQPIIDIQEEIYDNFVAPEI